MTWLTIGLYISYNIKKNTVPLKGIKLWFWTLSLLLYTVFLILIGLTAEFELENKISISNFGVKTILETDHHCGYDRDKEREQYKANNFHWIQHSFSFANSQLPAPWLLCLFCDAHLKMFHKVRKYMTDVRGRKIVWMDLSTKIVTGEVLLFNMIYW